MDKFFVFEFLFRGGPTSSPDDDTWHVILGREVADPENGGKKLELTGALTPTQAEAIGFPLNKIVRGLNAHAIATAADVPAMRARLQEHEERNAVLERAVKIAATKVVDSNIRIQALTSAAKPKKSLLSKLSFGVFK